jgi:alkanesulfonate monooxygenase SsuD/methylene tetrahydromethanopterin reductase-like flavin-dependent oxidoreductase (luciferase family)
MVAIDAIRSGVPVQLGVVLSGDESVAATEANLRAAGAGAGRVHLGALASPGYVAWAWDEISRGARDHGRDPESIELSASVLLRVDRNYERARDAIITPLAQWLARVDWPVIEHSGVDVHRVAAIRRSVERYGPGPALPLVTDDVVNTFAAIGDPERVLRRLDEFVRVGVQRILAWPAPEPGRAGDFARLGEVTAQ